MTVGLFGSVCAEISSNSVPSSAGYKINNAEAGLLTCSDCDAFPSLQRTVAIDCRTNVECLQKGRAETRTTHKSPFVAFKELTAAGTVTDSHGFPF